MVPPPNLKEICPFDRLSVSLYDPVRKLFYIPYAYMKANVAETGEAALDHLLGHEGLERGARRIPAARVLVAAAETADAVLGESRGLVDRRDD